MEISTKTGTTLIETAQGTPCISKIYLFMRTCHENVCKDVDQPDEDVVIAVENIGWQF